MTDTRICHRCNEPKALSRFGKRKRCLDCCVADTRRYRERNPLARKQHYDKNKVKVLAQAAIYRAANKEQEAAARRGRYERNKERVAAVTKAYREANPDLYAEAFARRRASKRRALPKWASRLEIAGFYEEAARLTKQTGIPHEVDHIVPLQSKVVCGLHCPANLRVIPRQVNRSKANKWDVAA